MNKILILITLITLPLNAEAYPFFVVGPIISYFIRYVAIYGFFALFFKNFFKKDFILFFILLFFSSILFFENHHLLKKSVEFEEGLSDVEFEEGLSDIEIVPIKEVVKNYYDSKTIIINGFGESIIKKYKNNKEATYIILNKNSLKNLKVRQGEGDIYYSFIKGDFNYNDHANLKEKIFFLVENIYKSYNKTFCLFLLFLFFLIFIFVSFLFNFFYNIKNQLNIIKVLNIFIFYYIFISIIFFISHSFFYFLPLVYYSPSGIIFLSLSSVGFLLFYKSAFSFYKLFYFVFISICMLFFKDDFGELNIFVVFYTLFIFMFSNFFNKSKKNIL